MNTLKASLAVPLLLLGCVSSWLSWTGQAAILQGAGANFVAFEAEENVALTPGAPTSWVITNDVTPSGAQALFAAGVNNTTFPSSFASYAIKFTTPGAYKIFLSWRANEDFTADPNAANSYFAPLLFNASTMAVDPNPDYGISTINNSRNKPASHAYGLGTESALVTVTQEQVDAGLPLLFNVGTREAGLMIDRFVLTLESTLTDAQFNALPNSDTDVFVQPAGANYVAFEAESPKVRLIAGAPTSWIITNDVTPSGDKALFAAGVNNTTFPSSFASYTIKFSTPGAYKIFLSWRANEDFTADPNAANSYFAPLLFNASTMAVDPNPDYGISTINNSRNKPASHAYGLGTESALVTVTQEQVDAGLPLLFNVGTREAGLMIDRLVLTLESTLTDAQFNALENTGAAVPPVITKAVGSVTLTNVTITFSKALDVSSLFPEVFMLDGGVTVLSAALDPVTLKDIILRTSPQTPGQLYTVTVNGITDLSGNAIAPNSRTNFFAWRLASGFARRETYLVIPGTDVNSLLTSAKYPDSPDRSDVVKGLASIQDPRAADYGVRLTGYFTPTQNGPYEFFMYNDDEAELSLSLDDTPDQLQVLLTAPRSVVEAFDSSVLGLSPALVAGQRYYIQVLLKQGNEFDAFVNIGARRQGDPVPVEELQTLGGNQLSTFIDPATARVNITRQPASVTTTTGHRARFEATANSPGGPVFYQWQLNGTDIPGATRAAYYTPVLSPADSGRQYRCLICGGGIAVTSMVATLTVNGATPPTTQPFIGVSFIGGSVGQGPGASLRSNDVVGIVPQANYNNLPNALTDGGLVDAEGALSPVTITYTANSYFTASGENTAEDVLFQGYLQNANNPVMVTLNKVPAGVYHLIVYAVGFNFNATYEQALELSGAAIYPVYHVRAEHAAQYLAAPGVFRRMSSTNPDARDQGNYVMFENVSPDPSGGLALTVSNESTFTGVNANPALSGFQLVRVLPALSLARHANGMVVLSWGSEAAGYILESSTQLGAGASWSPVGGAPNPIAGAGSIEVIPSASRFYRLSK